MNRTTYLMIACLMGSIFMFGQQVTWMPDQSAFGKEAEIYIADWGDKDILIHEGNSLYVLDKATLKIRETHSIKGFSKAKGGVYLGIMKTENGWVGLGSECASMQKKDTECHSQYSILNQEGFAAPKNWLTYSKKLNALSASYLNKPDLEVSGNGKYILQWSGTNITVYDASFNEVYSKDLPDIYTVNEQDAYIRTSERVIDDKGNFYMAGILINDKKKVGDTDRYHPFFLQYDWDSDQFNHHVIKSRNAIMLYPRGKNYLALSKDKVSPEDPKDDAKALIDLKNRRMAITGLYGDSNSGGIFSVQYDIENNEVIPIEKHPFPSDLTKQVSDNSFKGKEVDGLVVLQDVLVKDNGEIMVFIELDKSKLTPSNTTAANCLDILYFNIGNDNRMSFYGSIPKHQSVGERPQLSFATACTGNDVYVVFNTLSKKSDQELVSIKIGEGGKTERRSLLKLDNKNSILPDKLGSQDIFGSQISMMMQGAGLEELGTTKPVQISENEILIRAVKDNKKSLMKITF